MEEHKQGKVLGEIWLHSLHLCRQTRALVGKTTIHVRNLLQARQAPYHHELMLRQDPKVDSHHGVKLVCRTHAKPASSLNENVLIDLQILGSSSPSERVRGKQSFFSWLRDGVWSISLPPFPLLRNCELFQQSLKDLSFEIKATKSLPVSSRLNSCWFRPAYILAESTHQVLRPTWNSNLLVIDITQEALFRSLDISGLATSKISGKHAGQLKRLF
jgi:hypothetical protein